MKHNKVIFNIWETVSFLIFWHALSATLQTTKLYSFRARNDKEFLDFWHKSRYSNVNSLPKITQIAYLIPEAWDGDFIDVTLTARFLETRISVHVETTDWKVVGTRPVAKSLEFTKNSSLRGRYNVPTGKQLQTLRRKVELHRQG